MIAAHNSLNDVERQARDGTVTEDEVTEYIRGWNAFPGHFTQAVFADGRVRNFDPEANPGSYRHLHEKYGVRV